MWAAARFDADDAVGLQGGVANQKFGVFLGIDIVSDDGDIKVFSHLAAQGPKQSCFTGPDRTTDSDPQCLFGWLFSWHSLTQLLNNRLYWVSWAALARAKPGRLEPMSSSKTV